MNITTDQIEKIVLDYCEDKGIKAHPNFCEDFQHHLKDVTPITSFGSMRLKFCRRIKEILDDDDEMDEKYGELFSIVRGEIRMRLLVILGLKEYAIKPMRLIGISPRILLRQFVEELPEGHPWSPAELSRWRPETGLGERLYNAVKIVTRGWDENIARIILGDNALFQKHPFKRKETRLYGRYDARRYLKEFSLGFTPGMPWSYVDLLACEKIGADGPSGATLYHWMLRNLKDPNGLITELVVRKVFGSQADELLERNPFCRKYKICSIDDARFYLKKFIAALDKRTPFSPRVLRDYGTIGKDGPSGATLYEWLRNNIRDGEDINWIFVLTKMLNPGCLRKHPFTYQGLRIMPSGHEPSASTTSKRPNLDGLGNEGSLEDTGALTGEDILIANEAKWELEENLAAFRKAVRKLPSEDRVALNAFKEGQDVPSEQLEMIISRLREIIASS